MITTVCLVNTFILPRNYLFVCVVITFKIYSLNNFQEYNIVLLSLVTKTYASYSWKFAPFDQHLPHSPQAPAPVNHHSTIFF